MELPLDSTGLRPSIPKLLRKIKI
ncbi:hypothetical protein Ahy_A01g001789 isoform C [Arachis hypogaea]|uniref:Uncharacterized protein n=1 Tax=Arachis hypogaea TaxID=3818 RepID=A0A445EPX1_ARAHY|nr:hypothetical protein Ahy_A01g001789 isoform C [Arachis hypogaea]